MPASSKGREATVSGNKYAQHITAADPYRFRSHDRGFRRVVTGIPAGAVDQIKPE
jgi:hypothetical protein